MAGKIRFEIYQKKGKIFDFICYELVTNREAKKKVLDQNRVLHHLFDIGRAMWSFSLVVYLPNDPN